MSRLDEGIVAITLDGERVELVACIAAAKSIGREFGGLVGALSRVHAIDLEAIAGIIAAGSGRDRAAVEEQVYRTGAAELAPGVSEYVTLLSFGGRKPEPSPGKAPAAGP